VKELYAVMKRKAPTPRRQKSEESHWLGDGIALQESLLFDLDPFSYALDGALASTASRVVHKCLGSSERPLALLVPPRESIPWQLGVLSKKFDIFIWAENYDAMLESAAVRFNATLLNGDLPENASFDFILFTTSDWQNAGQLSEALEEGYRLVSERGSACFILRAAGEREICWGDGSRSSVEAIRVVAKFESVEHTAISLRAVFSQTGYGVAEFAKRNRDFFGRYAQDLCLSRLYEEEFQRTMESSAVALLLTVNGFRPA
jgi:hypothetical protein